MSTIAFRPLALAAVLLGMTIPTGLVAPSAMGVGPCNGFQETVEEDIKQSSPLEGFYTTTEIVHRVAAKAEDGEDVVRSTNGVDAYVHDLRCHAGKNGIHYTLYDRTEDFDTELSIAFYDENFEPVEPAPDAVDPGDDGEAEGFVPETTRYVVVVLDQGPLVAGMDASEAPPEPYSAQFELDLRK